MPTIDFLLEWDKTGERLYETGTDRCVLYPTDASGQYGSGVAWNGLTSVSESPSGAEETKLFADNQKYLSLFSAEEFGATIEAYTYPDEWALCDGSAELVNGTGVYAGQQDRRAFGLAYRTIVGNDTQGSAYGYKIHLIYGAKASPSQKSYSTVNDSPEAVTLSWEVTTTPINISGRSDLKPTATMVIDTTKLLAQTGGDAKLQAIESALYGTPADETNSVAAVQPRLLMPDEIIQMLQ